MKSDLEADTDESFVQTWAADLHCTKLRSTTHILQSGPLESEIQNGEILFLLPLSEISSKLSSLAVVLSRCFSGSLCSPCLPALAEGLWRAQRRAQLGRAALQASFHTAVEMDAFLFLWLSSGSFQAGILPQFVASEALCKAAAHVWIHSLCVLF